MYVWLRRERIAHLSVWIRLVFKLPGYNNRMQQGRMPHKLRLKSVVEVIRAHHSSRSGLLAVVCRVPWKECLWHSKWAQRVILELSQTYLYCSVLKESDVPLKYLLLKWQWFCPYALMPSDLTWMRLLWLFGMKPLHPMSDSVLAN